MFETVAVVNRACRCTVAAMNLAWLFAAVVAFTGATAELLRRPRAMRHLPTTGRAGSHAASLAHKADARFAPWRRRVAAAALVELTGAFVVPSMWPFNFEVSGHRRLDTTAMVVAVYLAGHLAVAGRRFANPDAARAAVGSKAEADVARLLDRRFGAAVSHSVVLGAGGDCDHVVVAGQLVAVETKYGRGPVRVDAAGLVHAGNKRLPRDPLGQLRRQRDALGRLAGTAAFGVLVVSGGRGLVTVEDRLVVCGAADLGRALALVPVTLDDTAAARIRARVAAVAN